jgi:RNA polymerase sigma-70 factor (ECF subfamily)
MRRLEGMFDRNPKPLSLQRVQFEKEALIHLDALYATALRLTQDARDAEDLVQDTVLQAYRAFDGYEPGTRCKAWLFKILTNTFINKYRRRVLEHSVEKDMKRGGETGLLHESGSREAADPEDKMHFRLLSESIAAALAGLPEEFRLPVLLCDVEEFSYREIADILDCPVGTVMSRLHRGRRQLQLSLREQAIRSGIVKDDRGNSHEQGRVIPLPRRTGGRN